MKTVIERETESGLNESARESNQKYIIERDVGEWQSKSERESKTKTKPPQRRSQSNKTVNKSAHIERDESKNRPTDPIRNRPKNKPSIKKQEQSETVRAPSESSTIKPSQTIQPRAAGWGDHVPAFIQVRSRASN